MFVQNCVRVSLLIVKGFCHGRSMQVDGNDSQEAQHSSKATETERDVSMRLYAWFPIIFLRGSVEKNYDTRQGLSKNGRWRRHGEYLDPWPSWLCSHPTNVKV